VGQRHLVEAEDQPDVGVVVDVLASLGQALSCRVDPVVVEVALRAGGDLGAALAGAGQDLRHAAAGGIGPSGPGAPGELRLRVRAIAPLST
jgi:hypothetical protein